MDVSVLLAINTTDLVGQVVSFNTQYKFSLYI